MRHFLLCLPFYPPPGRHTSFLGNPHYHQAADTWVVQTVYAVTQQF